MTHLKVDRSPVVNRRLQIQVLQMRSNVGEIEYFKMANIESGVQPPKPFKTLKFHGNTLEIIAFIMIAGTRMNHFAIPCLISVYLH